MNLRVGTGNTRFLAPLRGRNAARATVENSRSRKRVMKNCGDWWIERERETDVGPDYASIKKGEEREMWIFFPQ